MTDIEAAKIIAKMAEKDWFNIEDDRKMDENEKAALRKAAKRLLQSGNKKEAEKQRYNYWR